MKLDTLSVLALVLTSCASSSPRPARPTIEAATAPSVSASAADGSTLGAFSISLAVKDLAASRAFYEKLGFVSVMGEPTQNWLILRNGATTIGLFQGMFDRNTLTFNPGWNSQAKPVDHAFEDVRAVQKRLKASGVTFALETDESKTGPGAVMLLDPDGNPVLIDQHVN